MDDFFLKVDTGEFRPTFIGKNFLSINFLLVLFILWINVRIMSEIESLTHVDTVTDPGREFLIAYFATFIVSDLGSRFNKLLEINVIEVFAITENSQKVL